MSDSGTIAQLVALLNTPTGMVAAGLLILYAGWRGWWVYGWVYRQMVQERDAWRSLASSAQSSTRRALDVAAPERE